MKNGMLTKPVTCMLPKLSICIKDNFTVYVVSEPKEL